MPPFAWRKWIRPLKNLSEDSVLVVQLFVKFRDFMAIDVSQDSVTGPNLIQDILILICVSVTT